MKTKNTSLNLHLHRCCLVQYAKPVDHGYLDSVRIDNQLSNSHQLIWTDRMISYHLFFLSTFYPGIQLLTASKSVPLTSVKIRSVGLLELCLQLKIHHYIYIYFFFFWGGGEGGNYR